MTLTLYDFNSLDEKSKGEAVFLSGTFIDDREVDQLKVQLYRVGSFCVEVYYDPVTNAVLRYQAFQSSGKLGPYLKLKMYRG